MDDAQYNLTLSQALRTARDNMLRAQAIAEEFDLHDLAERWGQISEEIDKELQNITGANEVQP